MFILPVSMRSKVFTSSSSSAGMFGRPVWIQYRHLDAAPSAPTMSDFAAESGGVDATTSPDSERRLRLPSVATSYPQRSDPASHRAFTTSGSRTSLSAPLSALHLTNTCGSPESSAVVSGRRRGPSAPGSPTTAPPRRIDPESTTRRTSPSPPMARRARRPFGPSCAPAPTPSLLEKDSGEDLSRMRTSGTPAMFCSAAAEARPAMPPPTTTARSNPPDEGFAFTLSPAPGGAFVSENERALAARDAVDDSAIANATDRRNRIERPAAPIGRDAAV
mmetsp:Transcript_35230/g.75194  ORF Transcript_35230/g.75194 Transcript_35230/m.75194 type:complete len:276 (+) Transcript_35230:611-1438(+)